MKTIYFLLISLFLLGGNVSAQEDWANLKCFQQDNEALGTPAKGEKRVVFMGNSITIGWLHNCPEFFKDRPYINRGISGQTTPQMLLRFRQDVIDLQPKVVVILAGTNDIAGNTGPSTLEMIENNLASMAELARANGIKVILCSVLPAYDYPWRKGLEPNVKIPLLNKWIEAYAEKNKFTYLDYFSAMVDDKNGMQADLSGDGVHPNKKGYVIMQTMVEKAITKAIK